MPRDTKALATSGGSTEKILTAIAGTHGLASAWRVLFENSDTAIAFLDDEGSFLAVNQSFCFLTGYTQTELVGRMTFVDITEPKDSRVFREELSRVVMGEKVGYEIPKFYIRKDGYRFPVIVKLTRIAKDDGSFAFCVKQVMEDLQPARRIDDVPGDNFEAERRTGPASGKIGSGIRTAIKPPGGEDQPFTTGELTDQELVEKVAGRLIRHWKVWVPAVLLMLGVNIPTWIISAQNNSKISEVKEKADTTESKLDEGKKKLKTAEENTDKIATAVDVLLKEVTKMQDTPRPKR